MDNQRSKISVAILACLENAGSALRRGIAGARARGSVMGIDSFSGRRWREG